MDMQPRLAQARLWAATPVALAYMALIGLAYVQAGVFEYPLDDTYIHLSMAEQIAAGGYGVNAGDPASAASSPLYPFLLAPFATVEAGRYIPALIAVLSLAGSVLLWAAICARAGDHHGMARWQVLAFAALVPFGLNFAGIAMIGMEHGLHVLAVLMILRGAQDFCYDGRVSGWLYAGVALGPMIRLEGLALSLFVALVVVFYHKRAGAVLLGLALTPAILFAGFLVSKGLEPLPSSVTTKLVGNANISADAALWVRIAGNMMANVGKGGGIALALLLGVLLVGRKLPDPKATLILGAFALAGVAHLMLGRIGWMDRYEIYILVALAGAAVMLARNLTGLLIALVICTLFYAKQQSEYPPYPRSIYLQQAQMADFVQNYAQVPVAVNDLGRVAWRNPNYVLDLWGLASSEARLIRLSNPERGWMTPLVARHNVELALLYGNWFVGELPDTWIALGMLKHVNPSDILGGDVVTFYATSPAARDTHQDALISWAANLPEGAIFEMKETAQ